MIELDLALPLARFRLEVAVSLASSAVAVLGPSGSGKTSLLEAIAGLRRHATGRIQRDGEVLLDSSSGVSIRPERRRIGYVPQDALLFPHRDVERNVRFGLRKGGGSHRVFQEAVEILEIGPLLSRFPVTLSGGERQRVALARALAVEPRLLLLDEPLAAVDVELKARILPYLMRIRDEKKIPLLYVTHNAGEAEALAGEVLLLREGRVEAHGPATGVIGERSLSAIDPSATFDNVIDGTLGEDDEALGAAPLHVAGGGVLFVPPSGGRAGRRSIFTVAPGEILLSAEPLPRVSARNVLPGRVSSVVASGREAIVRIEAAGISWRADVTSSAVRDLGLEPQATAWIVIKAHSFRRLR